MAETPMPKYAGNSKVARNKTDPEKTEEKAPLEKVTTGKVVERKQPLGRRIMATFAGDDAHSVGQFVLFDVIMPAVKSTITDVVSQGIERMLYGDARPRSSRPIGTAYGAARQTSYNRPVARAAEPTRREFSQQARATHNFREIILETRGEAEMVLDTLRSAIDKYDMVQVSDLYAAVGISGSWQDDKWGWFDLRDSGVRQVRGGYLLELPAPEEVSR